MMKAPTKYVSRRRAEVLQREKQWFDLKPVVSKKQQKSVLFPIRVDEKTVLWLPEHKLASRFPLPFRNDTLEEYKTKFLADPKNFAY